MHGAGNDYIYIYLPNDEDERDWSAVARAVSHRHYGIGADGLILVLPDREMDFGMRMFNADGSEGQMCGTGIRCLCRYVWDRGLTQKTELVIRTASGPIKARLITHREGLEAVEVNLGKPRLRRSDVPMKGLPHEIVIGESLPVGAVTFQVTCLSMGNPHCVIFVDDVWAVRLEELGPLIEHHSAFPDRTNVEFVQVINSSRLAMRIWERGSGITLSSGTGSAASAVAAVLNEKADRHVTVQVPGGELEVHWHQDGEVWQRGDAVDICSGMYNWEAMQT